MLIRLHKCLSAVFFGISKETSLGAETKLLEHWTDVRPVDCDNKMSDQRPLMSNDYECSHNLTSI